MRCWQSSAEKPLGSIEEAANKPVEVSNVRHFKACHILASRMSATVLHTESTGSRCAKISFRFTRVYKLTMFLVSVHSKTRATNPKSTSTKDKTECVDKDKVLIPRRGEAAPTPCSRPSRSIDATPKQYSRPSHAVLTQLPRSADAPLTPLPRRALAPLTQH